MSLQFANATESFNINSQENMGDPNSAIKIQDVVQFKISKIEHKDGSKVTIQLLTNKNFLVYEDKLNFHFIPNNSLTYTIKYTPSQPAESYLDPFYKKEKNVFKNGSVFILQNNKKIAKGDKLEIDVQSCSQSVCLVPAKLSILISEGEVSEESKNSSIFSKKDPKENTPDLLNKNTISQITLDKNIIQNTEIETSDKLTMLNESIVDNIALEIQNALKAGSFILFPALFLAGLLMNLTPCVYPMIPITLNVLSQFGRNEKKSKLLPVIYVAGMIATYSILGVFAGITGSVFGSQLASPIFSKIIAVIMFLLGLSMLGYFNLSGIQSFANKIPLAQNYPKIAVGTMGAVSGLVSAPCTGPVLSMILVLISQNKSIITGFTYMFFFSLGFGLPYLALGYFGQRLNRMPRFPRLLNFTKIFFAALMFSLAIYFVRFTFQTIPFVQEIFYKPQLLSVIILILVAIASTVLITKNNIIGKLSKTGLIISTGLLSLWLTLGVNNSFVYKRNIQSFSESNSLIHWIPSFDEAIRQSKETGKPIMFDVWAEWCAACLEMKATTWKDKELAEYLNSNFILVQLDYTETPDDINNLIKEWGVNGLPAVGFFKEGSTYEGKPDILFQGFSTANKLLNTAKKIHSKN